MEKKTHINVSNKERVASVVSGSALLWHAFSGKRKNILEGIAGGYMVFRGLSGYCPVYDLAGKSRLPDPAKNINIQTSLTINKPVQEVYDFWRKLENLPLFMKHLKSVEQKDSKTSEWKAYIPGGVGSIHWEAEIVKEDPNAFLGWNSLPGATIENAGKVVFTDAGENGTEIHVTISYQAPLGIAGEEVLSLFTPVFENMIKEDIRNFKRHIETGEIPTIKDQPSGKKKSNKKSNPEQQSL